MRPPLRRAVVALVVGPYVALSAAVAPEHVHEADAADHSHSAVHRHLQPHSVALNDHDHAQVADDDEHVVWLDSAALHQPGYQFDAPGLPRADRTELVPALEAWTSPPDYDTAPPHGPPRGGLSLRGPPFLSV